MPPHSMNPSVVKIRSVFDLAVKAGGFGSAEVSQIFWKLNREHFVYLIWERFLTPPCLKLRKNWLQLGSFFLLSLIKHPEPWKTDTREILNSLYLKHKTSNGSDLIGSRDMSLFYCFCLQQIKKHIGTITMSQLFYFRYSK